MRCGKISAIVIGSRENNDQDALTVEETIVKYEGNAVIINLNDDMISQLQKQPIRMSVADSLFAQIFLKYRSPSDMEAAVVADEDKSQNPQVLQSQKFFLKLTNGQVIQGEIDRPKKINMQCKFGEITIPQELIAGIRFHTDANDAAVVIMKNGDSITGVPLVATIQVTTDQSPFEIDSKNLESITIAENATFAKGETDFGPRWQLKAATSAKLPPQSSAPGKGN